MYLLFLNIDTYESDDDDNVFVEGRLYTIRNWPNNLQVWDDVELFWTIYNLDLRDRVGPDKVMMGMFFIELPSQRYNVTLS